MVGIQVVWSTLSRNGGVEHPTEGNTIDVPRMYAKADNAPSELIHDHKHPVALQENGFTPKQVNAPQTVFRVSEEG
jgi:hypothetical protein